jgi:hypothetical protein
MAEKGTAPGQIGQIGRKRQIFLNTFLYTRERGRRPLRGYIGKNLSNLSDAVLTPRRQSRFAVDRLFADVSRDLSRTRESVQGAS